MKPKKQRIKLGKLRYVLIGILLILGIFMMGSLILKYKVTPKEVYLSSNENLVDDGSFEKFNLTVGDCCNTNKNASKVFASKYPSFYQGQYSLELKADYQCACISKDVKSFDYQKKYLFSFYYKGDNPRFCIWDKGTNNCISKGNPLKTNEWSFYGLIFNFNPKSQNSSIFLYADSDGTKTVTNYYDDLQVRQLVPIPVNGPFSDDQEYVIKTKTENVVNGEKISEADKSGEAYYYVIGKPSVTIKFPYYEIIIIIIIIAIIARLIIMKDKEAWE